MLFGRSGHTTKPSPGGTIASSAFPKITACASITSCSTRRRWRRHDAEQPRRKRMRDIDVLVDLTGGVERDVIFEALNCAASGSERDQEARAIDASARRERAVAGIAPGGDVDLSRIALLHH